MRHIERRLSVALFLGKNSSTLGGGVCINRVECEFPFSTSFFSLLLSLSFFPSFLSFPSLLFSIPQRKRVKKARVYLFIRSKGLRTSVLMTDAYYSCVKHVGRQRTGRRYGKKFGVIARDDDSIWFPFPPSPLEMTRTWKKIPTDPDSLPSPIQILHFRHSTNSFTRNSFSLSSFRRGIFNRFVSFHSISGYYFMNVLNIRS